MNRLTDEREDEICDIVDESESEIPKEIAFELFDEIYYLRKLCLSASLALDELQDALSDASRIDDGSIQ